MTAQVKHPTAFMVVLFGCAFIAAFNENIINVALPDIMTRFDISAVTANWLVTGYMMVATISVAMMAFISRRLSLRKIVFVAAGIFIFGAIGCLVAPYFWMLLAFRLIQAIGTGFFIPTMMSTIFIVVPHHKVGTYMSIGSACICIGPALGPVISGIMVVCTGWRGIFIPPCIAMIVFALLAAIFLENVTKTSKPSIDIVSVILMAIGLLLIVFGLTQVTSQTLVAIACIVVGILVLILFGHRQLKQEQPLSNVRVLFSSRFSLAVVMAVVGMATTFSMSVLMPLYFQNSFLYSAMISGLLVLIPLVCNGVAAILAGRTYDAHGEWPLFPIGFACIVVGQLGVFLFAESMQLALVIVFICISYIGVGLVLSPSQTAGLKDLAPKDNPDGVSIINIFVQMAGALGPSLFVGIYSTSTATALGSGISAVLSNAHGFTSAVLVSFAIGVVGLIVAVYYALKFGRKKKAAAK